MVTKPHMRTRARGNIARSVVLGTLVVGLCAGTMVPALQPAAQAVVGDDPSATELVDPAIVDAEVEAAPPEDMTEEVIAPSDPEEAVAPDPEAPMVSSDSELTADEIEASADNPVDETGLGPDREIWETIGDILADVQVPIEEEVDNPGIPDEIDSSLSEEAILAEAEKAGADKPEITDLSDADTMYDPIDAAPARPQARAVTVTCGTTELTGAPQRGKYGTCMNHTNNRTDMTNSALSGFGLNGGTWNMYVRAGERFMMDVRTPVDGYMDLSFCKRDNANSACAPSEPDTSVSNNPPAANEPLGGYLETPFAATGKTGLRKGWAASKPLTITVTTPSGEKRVRKVVRGSGLQVGLGNDQWFQATETNGRAGVWQIQVETGDPGYAASAADPYTGANYNEIVDYYPRLYWRMGVQKTNADGTWPGATSSMGRMWTDNVILSQPNFKAGTTPETSPLKLFTINQYGKQYRVEMPQTHGIYSTYTMNSLGIVETNRDGSMKRDSNNNCTRVPYSVPSRYGSGTLNNGKNRLDFSQPSTACRNYSGFKFFTRAIDAGNPASVTYPSTNKADWVKPAYVAPAMNSFTLDRKTGVIRGKVIGQPVNVEVTIGAKNASGGFNGKQVTLERQISPNANAQNIVTWDRKDSTGQLVPATESLKVEVKANGAAPIHVVRNDVEYANGGVGVFDGNTRLNLRWDDRKLTAGDFGTPPKPNPLASLDGTKNGSQHKWIPKPASNQQSWGNDRLINDWAMTSFTNNIDLPPSAILNEPRLRIDKRQLGTPVIARDAKTARITWEVDVESWGTGPASAVMVRDTLPTGAKGVKVDSVTQGSANAAGTVWTVGTLAVGTKATMRISADVPLGAFGTTSTFKNKATTDATDIPPHVGSCQVNTSLGGDTDRCDEITTTINVPTPSWTMSKVADPESGELVGLGQDVTYTISVNGTSNYDVANVKVTDDLSEVLKYAKLKEGSLPAGATLTGNILTWQTDVLEHDKPQTFSYTVTVNQDAADVLIKNLATGSADVPPEKCAPNAPCSTEHPTPKWPELKAPMLGSSGAPWFMLGAGALVLAGAAIAATTAVRRKRANAAASSETIE